MRLIPARVRCKRLLLVQGQAGHPVQGVLRVVLHEGVPPAHGCAKGGGVMALPASELKAAKYSSAGGRELYAKRERLAKAVLELMGIAVEPVGNGTMEAALFEGWHTSGAD